MANDFVYYRVILYHTGFFFLFLNKYTYSIGFYDLIIGMEANLRFSMSKLQDEIAGILKSKFLPRGSPLVVESEP